MPLQQASVIVAEEASLLLMGKLDFIEYF